jgi:hypothetical protein
MSGLNEMMFRAGIWAALTYNETRLAPQLDEGLETYYTQEGR